MAKEFFSPPDQAGLTDAQLRASPVPVAIDGTIVAGDVNIHASDGSSVNASGGYMDVAAVVSNFPVTQTVTQGTSPWDVSGTVTADIGTTGGLALDATLTNATQKTQVVDASGNVYGPRTGVGFVNYFPVINLEGASNGAAVALRSLQIGGSDGTNLRTLATDTTGKLNLNNISGTITLPTGAATETTLSSINTKTPALGQALAAASSPVVLTAAQLTTLTPLTTVTSNIGTTNGLALDATLTGGTQKTKLVDTGGTNVASISAAGALKVDGSAVTQPITPKSSTIRTYSTTALGFAPAIACTDFFTITGNAVDVVTVKKIVVTGAQTTSAQIQILLVKRSTANTGGTGFPLTGVPHDSNDAAASSAAVIYTANPTTGTLVGVMRAQRIFINAPAVGSSEVVTWDFGANTSKGVVLRGLAQVLAVNLNGATITGGTFDVYIEWTEE